MNTLRFRAIVEDQASKKLAKIKKGFDDIGGPGSSASLFGTVGAIAVAKGFSLIEQAGQAAINFLQDATKAALAEEESIAKLDAALRANVPSWDGQRDKIEEVLQARMRLGFSDDEQRESLALLVAATKDENKALEMQRAAMDLARLKRIDLRTASEGLVKVEAGSFRILKSLGIQLDENATKEEALAAVQKVAAGQAEAYAQTNSGKLLASQIKFGEMMERLGAKIIPGVIVVVEELSGVVDGLSAIIDLMNLRLPDTEEGMANLTRTINSLNPMTWAFTRALDETQAKLEAANKEARQKAFEELASTLRPATDAFDSFWSKVEEGTKAGKIVLKDGALVMASELPAALDEARRKALAIASRTPGEIAAALRDKRAAWQRAVDLLGDDLEKELTTAAEMAKIRAELAGENLARGLKSKDPVVRAQAEETRRILTSRLAELQEDARTSGAKIGDNFAKGLESKQHKVEQAASKLAGAVGLYLKVSSPAEKGPLSQQGGPEGWGARAGELYARGWADRLSRLGESLDGALRGGASGGMVAQPAYAMASGSRRPIVVYLDGREVGRGLVDPMDDEMYWRMATTGSATIEG